MAKAMGLIFSLFDITSTILVPFGIPQCIQCMLDGLSCVLLCVPFIFADSAKCRFTVVLCKDSLRLTGIVRVFHCDWVDCRDPSPSVLV